MIDPGQAFGTGAHATTRLCLELLLELAALEDRPGPLLDVGTGSGVLAIAAARLGFAPVLGLDHERESVAAAQENARVNGVAIEVRRFDLRTQTLPWLERDADSDPADGPSRIARGGGEPAASAAARSGARDAPRPGASAGRGAAEGAGRRGRARRSASASACASASGASAASGRSCGSSRGLSRVERIPSAISASVAVRLSASGSSVAARTIAR